MLIQYSMIDRRFLLKSSAFGLLAAALPSISYARQFVPLSTQGDPKLFSRYPSIDDEIVSEVVGKSHFNLERVKELVDARPELARATWDWSFGDWESALGAASHVGRRDIAQYLISMGARPDIFTHAMLGHIEVVKHMVQAIPGIQSTQGPHGISLQRHTEAGLRMTDDMTDLEKRNSEELIAWLESIGGADIKEKDIPLTPENQAKYLGDYRYGEGPTEGFSVRLNMTDRLCLGKLGQFGGALYQKEENKFTYNGISSVEIHFELKDGKVIALSIHEPDFSLKALKAGS
jgi:hypothetical protein